MSNPDHLARLRKGAETWNAWRWAARGTTPDLSSADLKGMDLTYFVETGEVHGEAMVPEEDLAGIDFRGTILRSATLVDTDLQLASLEGADLRGADLRGADLSGANLSAANLSLAEFSGANLSQVSLRKANLAGAKMSSAVGLTQSQVDSAMVFGDTELPAGLHVPAAGSKKVANLEEKVKLLEQLSEKNAKIILQLRKQVDKFDKGSLASEKATEEALDKLKYSFDESREGVFKVQQKAEALVESLKSESQNLKESYAAQLQLEAPAKLWKDQAEYYGEQASFWSVRAVLASVLFLVAVMILLVFFSDIFFPAETADLGAAQVTIRSIRSVLLVGTLVSVGAYIVGILVRLALSAYHLERDASERRQLTLFYLALLKEAGGASEQDREIILQALFSRAETGLLRKDSGPTMPSSQLTSIVNPNKPKS